MEHRDLHVLRWALCDVNVTGAVQPEDIVDRVRISVEKEIAKENGGFLAARIHIFGPCLAHGELSLNPEKWTNEVRSPPSRTHAEVGYGSKRLEWGPPPRSILKK